MAFDSLNSTAALALFFFFSLYSVDVLSVWTGTHPKRHATSYSYIIHVSNDELEILTVSLE